MMLSTSYSVDSSGSLDRVKQMLKKPEKDVTGADLVQATIILDHERQRDPNNQEITMLFLQVYSLCSQIH